jgi:hypothetical protein
MRFVAITLAAVPCLLLACVGGSSPGAGADVAMDVKTIVVATPDAGPEAEASFSCDPDERFCLSTTRTARCNLAGTGYLDVKTCAGAATCHPLKGACATPWCTAGARDCAAASVAVECDASGHFQHQLPCPAAKVCVVGECLTCVPGARICKGLAGADECAADGSGWSSLPCPAGSVCTGSGAACVPTVCTPGDVHCVSATSRQVCTNDGLYLVTETCDAGETCVGGACSGCSKGPCTCESGSAASVCNPDGTGTYTTVPCANGEACDPALGACVAATCTPGDRRCACGQSLTCTAQGTSWTGTLCDPVQGLACDEATGSCLGPCSEDKLERSYIGCDYFPVTTANLVDPAFTFAVVVSNASDDSVSVLVTRGDEPIFGTTVFPNQLEVIALPWVFELSAGSTSRVAVGGAYRLRANRPVTAYQYSPLEYRLAGAPVFSYTNDASLLLPAHAWGDDYAVVSREHWTYPDLLADEPGLYAVAAAHDGTELTLTAPAGGSKVSTLPGLESDGNGKLVLNRGDVLQVCTQGPVSDLTGTRVQASKPVQVIGGHRCTFVPASIGWCDHLEESIPPRHALGDTYYATAPLLPSALSAKARKVRVLALEAGVTLTYDPPLDGWPTSLAKQGDWFEEETDLDFRVIGTGSLLVAQYMLGQDAGGGAGDPAMEILVTPLQFRSVYLFHAPTHYTTSFVNLVAPLNTALELDGAPVTTPLEPIGSTGWGVANLKLPTTGGGTHRLEGTTAFGVSVYGYGQYTSYWYPGGLNLQVIWKGGGFD